MLFPLAVAFVSAALGVWLAFATESAGRAVHVIRWAAIAAAFFVIGTHLLPEAWEALGAWSLLALSGGAALPAAAEALVASLARRRAAHHAHPEALTALEIGYAALVAHQFSDGLSMGAYFRTSATFSAAAQVVLALAAHIVPVTTIMILAFLSLRGRKSALLRGTGLGASTMSGVVAAGFILPSEGNARLSAWISAAVAGLLLHIVTHDVPRERREMVG